MAYARYAKFKYDWVTHRQAQADRAPTDEEVTAWIADLTNSWLREIWNGATEFFNDAAGRYLADRLEAERAKAVDTSILGRVAAMAQTVERRTSFWWTLPANIFIGVVSSFLFAVLVLLTVAIYKRDPSVLGLFRELSGK